MALNFTIRSAKQFATKLSARIRKSGELGFGEKESSLMNLTDGIYIAFASNDENVAVTHLVIKRNKDDDSFPLKKANTKYPCVETKQLFDFFHIDYTAATMFFDLTRESSLDEELSGEVYRATLRINDKSNQTDDSNDE